MESTTTHRVDPNKAFGDQKSIEAPMQQWRREIKQKTAYEAGHSLYGLQGLQYVSLEIFKVFDSEAETDQVILDPVLDPIRLAEIPVSRESKHSNQKSWT